MTEPVEVSTAEVFGTGEGIDGTAWSIIEVPGRTNVVDLVLRTGRTSTRLRLTRGDVSRLTRPLLEWSVASALQGP